MKVLEGNVEKNDDQLQRVDEVAKVVIGGEQGLSSWPLNHQQQRGKSDGNTSKIGCPVHSEWPRGREIKR